MFSAEAWCCPPKVIQQFVQDLSNRNDVQTANAILQNYASCISAEDAETRRSAAIGIAEIAELYGEGDGSLLIGALTNTGATLASGAPRLTHPLNDRSSTTHAESDCFKINESKNAIEG
jgi:hypothetical protein